MVSSSDFASANFNLISANCEHSGNKVKIEIFVIRQNAHLIKKICPFFCKRVKSRGKFSSHDVPDIVSFSFKPLVDLFRQRQRYDMSVLLKHREDAKITFSRSVRVTSFCFTTADNTMNSSSLATKSSLALQNLDL